MSVTERERLLRRLARRERLGWMFVRAEAAWARSPRALQAMLRVVLKQIPVLRRAARQTR